MSIMGIGPVLAIVGGASLAVMLVLRTALGIDAAMPPSGKHALQFIGAAFVVIGVFFWMNSAIRLARAFTSHRLETSGVFRLTRNPLYAAFIVFIVPGIAFLCNNLLILLVSAAMYIAFKRLIVKEEEFLQREFGEEFRSYAREVAQLIPFVKL